MCISVFPDVCICTMCVLGACRLQKQSGSSPGSFHMNRVCLGKAPSLVAQVTMWSCKMTTVCWGVLTSLYIYISI